MGTVDLQIESVAFGGKGVGRVDGKAVFIPYTIDGEIVSARIVREKKQFADAEIVEVREKSPHRVEPRCPYFGRCGGCVYQHIDYKHQLAIKTQQVRDVLERIGKIQNPPVQPIVPSPLNYNYRNRITVHVTDGVVGFFRRPARSASHSDAGGDSNRLIDIEQCPIASDDVNRELSKLRAHKPVEGHYTLRAPATPRIFSQTNDAVAAALRDLVYEIVPSNQDLLIDAYCGAGFFSKALLDKFEKVIGIDWDKFAIAEAQKTATSQENYIAGDVETELEKVAAVHRTATIQKMWPLRSTAATMIVDPPATGLSPKVREAIENLAPDNFIYVSCNPATLARDLLELKNHFEIRSVTPLDMFPQTAEIEVVVSASSR